MSRKGFTDRRRKGVVLVVEDHPDTLAALAEHLEQHGWTVVLATDGDAALRIAQETRPDLVCLDLNLPGVSGFDVCERLRADPVLKDVVILMTSARCTLDVHAYSLEAGADAYVAKPYDLDRLMFLLDHLCSDGVRREANLRTPT
jgi:two-component system phosphate regulon response regulator PhoB